MVAAQSCEGWALIYCVADELREALLAQRAGAQWGLLATGNWAEGMRT